MFFRANSLSDSYQIIYGLFNDINLGEFFKKETYLTGFKPNEFRVVSIAILLLFIFEHLHRKLNVVKMLNNQATIFRWFCYLTIVLSIVVFGIYGDRNIQEFIYFQF